MAKTGVIINNWKSGTVIHTITTTSGVVDDVMFLETSVSSENIQKIFMTITRRILIATRQRVLKTWKHTLERARLMLGRRRGRPLPLWLVLDADNYKKKKKMHETRYVPPPLWRTLKPTPRTRVDYRTRYRWSKLLIKLTSITIFH